jgi:hypothetical protein
VRLWPRTLFVLTSVPKKVNVCVRVRACLSACVLGSNFNDGTSFPIFAKLVMDFMDN